MPSIELPSGLCSKAFEQQLLDTLDLGYGHALRLTRNRADAQDLVQDSAIRALRFHHTFKEGTNFRAWLLTIIRNTFINDYRRRARRPQTISWSGYDPSPVAEPDRDMGYFPGDLRATHVLEYLADDVREAVESLPEGHRRTIIMADLQDMSYKEIAAAMECPLGTVMSRLHRGRRLLRESLSGHRIVYS